MIVMMPNENLKKLSPEDKAFLTGFCAATDRAASLLYNLKFVYMDNFDIDGVNLVRFLDNHEEVRKTLEKSLIDWMETEAMEYLTQMIESEQE